MGDFVVQLLVNGRLCHPISCYRATCRCYPMACCLIGCYRAMRHRNRPVVPVPLLGRRNTMGCCFTNWVLGGGHVNGKLPSKPLKALDKDITPFEAWYNRKPNLGHIRIFGCKAYTHVPVQIRSKTLWDSHSTKCIVIECSDTENIYELSVITRGAAIRKRDVIFCENQLGSTVLMSDAMPRGQLIFPIEHPDTVHHFPAVYANHTLNSQPRPTPPATSTPVLDTFRKPIRQSIAQLPTPTPINDSGLCFMDPVVQSIQSPQIWRDTLCRRNSPAMLWVGQYQLESYDANGVTTHRFYRIITRIETIILCLFPHIQWSYCISWLSFLASCHEHSAKEAFGRRDVGFGVFSSWKACYR